MMKRILAVAACLLLAACEEPKVQRFKPGDIIETKVGRFRGTVILYRDDCSGVFVRFPTISMKAVCVLEEELRPA